MATQPAWLHALAKRLEHEPFLFPARASIAVGLSGGRDSVALLAALCHLGYREKLRAIHVDHGMQQDSIIWAERCAQIARSHEVPLTSIRIHIDTNAAEGLEDAARRARYAAFANALAPGEVLCTAHHGDDQLETLLYRFLRGTGVYGMRGVQECRSLGQGFTVRPLLHVSQQALSRFCRDLQLDWIEDPSNADLRFDRNFLRHQVLPQIRTRWPQAQRASQRLADSASDAIDIARDVAEIDLRAHPAFDQLVLAELSRLSPARCRNLLRFVIAELNLPMPSARSLGRLYDLSRGVAESAEVGWPGGRGRVHHGALFLAPPPATDPVAEESAHLQLLTAESPLPLHFGTLQLVPCDAVGLPNAWLKKGLNVVYRHGGEYFVPPRQNRRVQIREWMRQQNILPWMRDHVPLIVCDSEIVAVADIAVSAAAAKDSNNEGQWRVVWNDRPRIHRAGES